jgi:hypothetical protein
LFVFKKVLKEPRRILAMSSSFLDSSLQASIENNVHDDVFVSMTGMDFELPKRHRSLQRWRRLHVLAHHGNHQIEETDGLDEGETKNGVREELATERGVTGDTLEEGSEDETDTDTSLEGVSSRYWGVLMEYHWR